MNDDIAIASASLADFLGRLRLPQATCDRVVEIDRKLAVELESVNLDAEGCAALVIEAADLVRNAALLAFDWSGWGDDDVPGDLYRFDFDGIEWGKE
ncbi:hypothetical protein RvVAT039_04840 [Agrobacterium vitis]|uniref:hypothetical protein n=1 Tax=Agrobacterium vitis TaxID=373 RepID=UPI0015DAA3F5|nr:hypothetical protein [Agrobacterium vitis]BCH63268.1 hypothetical protein RvVAT039_04840 [Agrobacterium vitis]